MEVAVTTVSPRALPVSFDAVGQTAGSREVELRARVGGILQEQLYTEGAWVKAGTVLFKIDSAPYQAALSKAHGVLAQEEAQLAKATQDLERMRRLVDQGFVARKDYDDAVAAKVASSDRSTLKRRCLAPMSSWLPSNKVAQKSRNGARTLDLTLGFSSSVLRTPGATESCQLRVSRAAVPCA